MFQQMGFGVGVAVLGRARHSIRLGGGAGRPMVLLGRWNWYLPSWLERLPELHVEGSQSSSGTGGGAEDIDLVSS